MIMRLFPQFSSPFLTNKQPAQPQRDKPQRGNQQRGGCHLPVSTTPEQTQRTPYIPSTSACRVASCRSTSHADEDAVCDTPVRAKDNRPDKHKQNRGNGCNHRERANHAGIHIQHHHAAEQTDTREGQPFRGYCALREFSERFRCHTFLGPCQTAYGW